MGETVGDDQVVARVWNSLSVSSNGSTWVKLTHRGSVASGAFSLSVSSNGSTWVKLIDELGWVLESVHFQYPRTDRRG